VGRYRAYQRRFRQRGQQLEQDRHRGTFVELAGLEVSEVIDEIAEIFGAVHSCRG
jgi:hypothetical protein